MPTSVGKLLGGLHIKDVEMPGTQQANMAAIINVILTSSGRLWCQAGWGALEILGPQSAMKILEAYVLVFSPTDKKTNQNL